MNFFRAEFESKTIEILSQSVQVDSLGKWDGFPLDCPVDADLSRGSTMLLRDFSNDWVSQNVKVLLLSFANSFVGAAADSCVALDENVEFSVHVDQVILLKVGVHFDLVYSGRNLATCQQVNQYWD